MTDRSAIVVGAGIGGLTAALCLARTGWRVRVLERGGDVRELGAGLQVTPNSARVLLALGLGPRLEQVVSVPDAIELRDWASARSLFSMRLDTRAFGAPYWHIHRGDLIRVLADAVRARPDIELTTGASVDQVAVSATGASASFSGETVEASVMIAADGIRSTVRGQLFGEPETNFAGNVAWRGLVTADRLPGWEGLARTMVYLGPQAHLVCYPVRGGELINLVAVTETEQWEEESWSLPADVSALAQRFAGWHDTVTTLISAAESGQCFKWGLFDRPPMARYVNGRVALLGDAAHPMLPFLAQGAAMAVEDAAVLAESLSEQSVETGLQRYESERRPRTAWAQRLSRRNARIYHLEGMAAWMRNRVLGLAGRQVMTRLWSYEPPTSKL